MTRDQAMDRVGQVVKVLIEEKDDYEECTLQYDEYKGFCVVIDNKPRKVRPSKLTTNFKLV